MSLDVYTDAVETGLLNTKKKLDKIKQNIIDGALKGKVEKDFILQIGKFNGEFRHYTAKDLDELIEYCHHNEEFTLDIQKIIHGYQYELNGYEKEFNDFLLSRSVEERNNLNAKYLELSEEFKNRKAG